MKLGVVVDGSATFVEDLLFDWRTHYQTVLFAHSRLPLPFFEERINRWRLRNALKRLLYTQDVVIFEWAGPALVQATRLGGSARLIVRLHSWELFEHATLVDWSRVERVVLVSHAMQRRFRELYPAHANKTTVIHHGKPLDRFQPVWRPNGQVLGMLGSLVPIKRQYEMVLALHELRKQGFDGYLRLAGGTARGADNERYFLALQSLVAKLGLKDHVEFVGQVADPVSFLQTLDVFISNSFWEGQQVALIEAMATACYCLSHHWDGAEEILPAENLFISNEELKEKILAYIAWPVEKKRQERARLRQIAEEKFDIRDAVAAWRRLIEGIE